MKKDDIPPNAGSGTKPPTDSKEAPPGYDAAIAEAVEHPPDIVAAFAKLNLDRKERKPTPDECIAHLKLLECIATMREDVGAIDGLYGLFDSLAHHAPEGEERNKLLHKICEKRWAIFVVMAAIRFQAWFETGEKDAAECTLGFMESDQYRDVQASARPRAFRPDTLPPLDVLMVWHTFMLNPRKFLADCIRHNRIGLWRAGMPWDAVVASIDNTSFAYNPGDAAQKNFTAATGRTWNLLEATPGVTVTCPQCHNTLTVELTTCITDEFWRKAATAGEGGTGYADANFEARCACGLKINHEVLRVERFRRDLQRLLVYHVPMPGTLLSLDGLTPPARSLGARNDSRFNSTFRIAYPNRLLLSGAGLQIASVTQHDKTTHRLKGINTVSDIRTELEKAMKDKDIIRKASLTGYSAAIYREERIGIRRMMSCYWDDASIFSLDLAGAVIRQNVFMVKMRDIDWLHSPALRNTMARLIEKYERFFQIMRAHPKDVAVPTLDVDLAWHTHQLSPVAYRDYALQQCDVFIDHDDKIDENQLSTAFEWTSKTYEKLFGAVYSECTCWYCEAIREAHTSRVPRLFKSGKDGAAADRDRLHAGAPSDDPHKSPHISAHNAIKSQRNPDTKTALYVRNQQLERNYRRAVERAKKERRTPPRRDDYYYYPYWGYYYPMPFYAPYMGDPCINGGMYPANPGCANFGAGAVGNCAAGSCGGNVAAGGCAGGAATCGGGGGGGAACGGGGGGGCGGGGGGGGGGCGGGGGGGCGGGGGG